LTFSISAGQTQNIKVRFSPTSTAAKTATLNIANNSSDVPNKTISLQGNGTDHATKTLAVLPDGSYNFGNKTITEIVAEAFTLTNTGSSNLALSKVSISGINSSDFSLSLPETPPYDIPSNGGSSIIIANFKPGTVGSKTAKLIIANNADNKSPGDTITLYGNGTNSIYTGITNNIIGYEYWFDNNYTSKITTSIPPQSLSYINTNFSTTGLNIGEHTLHIRYQDQHGQWSAVSTQEFYKQPVTPDSTRRIVAYEYWFDSNFSSSVDSAINPQQTFSLSSFNTKSLSVGQHSYHVRFKDDLGQWSSVTSGNFYRSPIENGPNAIAAYRYWFDSNDKQKNTVNLSSPSSKLALSTNITTASLPNGTHTVHFQFKDAYSFWSAVTNDTITVQKSLIPIITKFSPTTGESGTDVTITGKNFTGADTVSFGGGLASSFTVSSDSVILATVGTGGSGSVAVKTVNGTATLAGFTFIFSLPAENFTISTTSATCSGVADGTINIIAHQKLNYTATVTGSSPINPTQFTTNDTIPNLAAGTYHLCITVQGQANYQQCYDLTIDQPKDLSVYSTVNDIDNTVTLLLNNGNTYNIQLNGIAYTTTNNNITLPLKEGDNQLSVTTDKPCQGTYQNVINILRKIVPYPDPFDNILSINLGDEQIDNVLFEVHDMGIGRILYTKQMANQAGVVQLDLSSLQEGVYALYIKADNIQRIYKIIKK
jgi:type IX secretion system substrate protein/HYDIN/CFA65/VesB family protein